MAAGRERLDRVGRCSDWTEVVYCWIDVDVYRKSTGHELREP
jgi:hypothetical protein